MSLALSMLLVRVGTHALNGELIVFRMQLHIHVFLCLFQLVFCNVFLFPNSNLQLVHDLRIN